MTQLYPKTEQLTQARRFLSLLGYKDGEFINFGGFLPLEVARTKKDKGRKAQAKFPNIPTDLASWEREGRGIYAVVNKGGSAIADITEGVALFYEHDQLDKETSAALWQGLGLPEPTFQVDTGGKSIHSYWALSKPVSPQDWRVLQTDLLEFADADRSLKNQNRVMRLPGFKHAGTGALCKIINCSEFTYSYADLRAIVPEQETKPSTAMNTPVIAPRSFDDDRAFARELLSYIPRRQPGSNTYNESFKVLAALVHKFGQDEGLRIAREWSPDTDWGEDLERKVRSLRGGSSPVTFGSLVVMAKQHGWVPAQNTDYQWVTEEPRPQTVKEIVQKDAVGEIEDKYKTFREALIVALQIPDPIEREFAIDELGIRFRKNRGFMRTVIDELEQRRKTAEGEKTEFDLVDLLNESTTITRYLIEDWIPQGESILLSAKPKTGKSLLAYDAAYAVATGSQFLGKRSKQGRVLIIQTEEGKGELKKRLDTRGFGDVERGQVKIWTKFKVHKDIPKLEAELAEFRPALVVVDSLRRVATGSGISENDAAFSQFVYDLSDSTRSYGASLIIVDHDKKSGEAQGIDNVSGSLSKVGGVWGSWRLLCDSTNENSPSRHLACVIRGGASSRHKIRLTEGEGCSWAWQWEQEIGADPEVHSHERNILAILNACRGKELSMSDIVQAAGFEKGSRIFYRPMNRLIEKGRIEMRRDENNRRLFWYSIPQDLGRTLPPQTNGQSVQPLMHKGSEVAHPIDQPCADARSQSITDQTLSQSNKETDQVLYLERESQPDVDQNSSDQMPVQPQNDAVPMVAHLTHIQGGECETVQPGYEVNGVWHYRTDMSPRFPERPKSIWDLEKERATQQVSTDQSVDESIDWDDDDDEEVDPDATVTFAPGAEEAFLRVVDRTLPYPHRREIPLTEGHPEWHTFETALIAAKTMDQLVAAKQATPEQIRVDCMEQWRVDGRYEWLTSKVSKLQNQ